MTDHGQGCLCPKCSPPKKACTVPGCGKKHYANGHCKKHYTQVDRHGRLAPERERGRPPEPCCAPKCDRTDTSRREDDGRSYCRKHYRQVRVHGRLVPEREHEMGHLGCRTPDCDKRHRAKGFCIKHYNQMRWQKMRAKLRRLEELEARGKLERGIAEAS